MSRHILVVLVTLLLLVVVFDPSDSLIGAKRYVFISLLVWWALIQIKGTRPLEVSRASLLIVLCFGLFLPNISMISLLLQGGGYSWQELLNSSVSYYSLVLLVPFSRMMGLVLPIFLRVIGLQVVATIAIYILVILIPDLTEAIIEFGYQNGFLWVYLKSYGEFQFMQVFFKTAPFMVFSVAYYSAYCFSSFKPLSWFAIFMLLASCFALTISGTRSNIMFAMIIPIYFVFGFGGSRKKAPAKPFLLLLLFAIFGGLIANADLVFSMFDPLEQSNSIKIGYLDDYANILSDPVVLLFGQGIGSVQYFPSFGEYMSATELTLLELIRVFGIVAALAYLGFWLAPLVILKRRRFTGFHWFRVAYGCYLVICLSNNFIISSTGMVLLSIVYGLCLIPANINYSFHKKLASLEIIPLRNLEKLQTIISSNARPN